MTTLLSDVARAESHAQREAATETGEVTFAGALPPPVTGMTAMTGVIVDALRARGPVRCINWSRGKIIKGWPWRLWRIWGAIRTFFALLLSGRGSNKTFYYAVSQGPGLTYDIVLTGLARALGYRVVLHHHSYSYIDAYSRRAAWLIRMAHANAVHCPMMQQHILARYATTAEFWFVPPTIVSQQLLAAPKTHHEGFTLGFISHIMLTKGIDEAILTFERLMQQGRNVRLIIAGLCHGRAEQELVDGAVDRWPGRVEYRGAVYGEAKAKYFSDLDVLVFPTRYKPESWGIVLTEAMRAEIPVLTRARACVPWIVRVDCGLVVAPEANFVDPAVQLIERWMDSPSVYAEACAAAKRRASELQADADRELPEFVEKFFNISSTTQSDNASR